MVGGAVANRRRPDRPEFRVGIDQQDNRVMRRRPRVAISRNGFPHEDSFRNLLFGVAPDNDTMSYDDVEFDARGSDGNREPPVFHVRDGEMVLLQEERLSLESAPWERAAEPKLEVANRAVVERGHNAEVVIRSEGARGKRPCLLDTNQVEFPGRKLPAKVWNTSREHGILRQDAGIDGSGGLQGSDIACRQVNARRGVSRYFKLLYVHGHLEVVVTRSPWSCEDDRRRSNNRQPKFGDVTRRKDVEPSPVGDDWVIDPTSRRSRRSRTNAASSCRNLRERIRQLVPLVSSMCLDVFPVNRQFSREGPREASCDAKKVGCR